MDQSIIIKIFDECLSNSFDYSRLNSENLYEVKTLITILFLSLLSFPSWSVTITDVVKREGVYYKKYSDVLFSGEIIGSFKGLMKNGKREGAWLRYYSNGQLDFKGSYKNGREEGAWIFYWNNGQLYSKGNYKNGRKEGEWVAYSRNGIPYKSKTGIFKNGVKIGG